MGGARGPEDPSLRHAGRWEGVGGGPAAGSANGILAGSEGLRAQSRDRALCGLRRKREWSLRRQEGASQSGFGPNGPSATQASAGVGRVGRALGREGDAALGPGVPEVGVHAALPQEGGRKGVITSLIINYTLSKRHLFWWKCSASRELQSSSFPVSSPHEPATHTHVHTRARTRAHTSFPEQKADPCMPPGVWVGTRRFGSGDDRQ